MTNSNSHFERYMMGQAYQQVTETMGPNPQLVAFVNYENISDQSLGLESFNILEQHEKIVSDIQADNAFELGCENFEEEILQFVDQLNTDSINDDYDSRLVDSMQLDQIINVHAAFTSFGVTKSSFGVAKYTGLLVGTSLDVIAVESFNPNSVETQTAIESIGGTIKEKAAQWSAKILTFIKKVGNMSFIDIGNKIQTATKALVTKVSDKAHDVGKTIKSHPYKTALITVAGITAAAVALTFIGQKLASNNVEIEKVLEEASEMFYKASGVKSTLLNRNAGAVKDFVEDRYYLAKTYYGYAGETPQVGTWQELGWTKSNIVAFSNKMKPLFDQVTHAITTFVSGATKYATSINHEIATEALKIPGASKRASHQTITTLYWAAYRLIKKQIGPGFHHIAQLILRLLGH